MYIQCNYIEEEYMKVDIIPIGNSRGIRIPKALLEQCGFGDSADVAIEDNHLVLRPAGSAREGWKESFSSMAASHDDVLLDAHQDAAFDESEWQW
jgi:antitoxin MazE